MTNIASLIQIQLDAYNSKDVDGLLATYAPDAQQRTLDGTLLAQGLDALRERFVMRFSEPNLHARLLSRTCMGEVVVDHELITRNFPNGTGTIEMLCIYEVRDGLIQTATFATGEQKLTHGATTLEG